MTIEPHKKHSMDALRSWAVVAFLLSTATVAGYAMDGHASLTSQALVYVLAVVLVSYSLRWKQSVVCAIGSVAAFNFFFVPPRWTFEVESNANLFALFAMLLVALVISRLAARLRMETEAAHRNAQRSRQLQELATALAEVTSTDSVASLGKTSLEHAFTGPCFLQFLDEHQALDEGDDVDVSVLDGMRCCMQESAVLGPGTGRWPGLNAWYLPLGDKGRMHGAVCIQSALAADTAGREHAQALCALLTQALWRLQLASKVAAAQYEMHRQQLHSTFLAAISHDLRTPLAAVVGAASALQSQREKLSAAEQDRLLGSIVSEASYLSNVTENTLQLMQLVNSSPKLQRDWESMEEIIGSVLVRVRQRDPTRRIKSKVPEGLPLIQADPVLLAQLLSNLLDNALKYSTEGIDLAVASTQDQLTVSVKDRGVGIPQDKQHLIFEPYSRNDQSGQRGAGLGLAVCRAIALAHGGSLTVRQRSGGGSCFNLTLPVETLQPPKDTP
jgi:two-component system sensor histidine kinase KdpD